jgi:uncharacterized protein YgiM (DUF1202 family)
MPLLNKILICAAAILFIPLASFAAKEQAPIEQPEAAMPAPIQKPILFQGEVTSDNINVRADSTVSSDMICEINEGDTVEVIKEVYEWYKIRLPKSAPAYISRNLVEPIDGKTAKVKKNNVNIRLKPDLAAPILGRVNKNEVIKLAEELVGWYKIEPPSGASGWVHKNFIVKADPAKGKKKEEANLAGKTDEESAETMGISVEGVIKPYGRVFRRVATHKLITEDKKIFLLKGSRSSLDSLNNNRVKVTGKLDREEHHKYPVIEIQKIEALD